ncbi:MAG: ATP-binding protein [Promethearchaeota archaeon]|nr:MAG: ATP-binding protein [Candidatus Lokiarchaeota archaeon]
MIEDILSRIRNIFVGRKPELQRLKGLWDLACQDKEHLVYVFLNAPGVGKTTLIHHFGKNLELEGKGLFIKYVCDSNFNSPQRINKEILNTIQNAIKNGTQTLENYWCTKEKEEDLEIEKENFQILKQDLRELLKDSKADLYNIYDILTRLSNIIPVFFAADEIQEFQKLTFKSTETEEETALHYFTRLLKSLLNLRMLLVLSGTRFHILSQIGKKLGSPIREKVESLVVTNFNRAEILEYVEQVKELIKMAEIKQEKIDILNLVNNYRQFLFAFSGGHPRTIERITMSFLNNISFLLEKSGYENHAKFINFLLPLYKKSFENTLLTKEKENELVKLSSNIHFSIVKKWIIEHSYNGHLLGQAPEVLENQSAKEEVNDLIYNLMNLGFIVQNGMLNYYITSYFHFLAFLKPYHEKHELFLKEILHNKFFELMCGYHSGFGYTFETIFSTALLIYGSKSKKEISVPLNASLLKGLKILKEKANWSEIPLDPYILYQTPLAKAVDAIIYDEEELVLIQITTARQPDSNKIDALVKEMDAIDLQQLKIHDIKIVRGWVVSLFEFTSDIPSHKNLLITAGDSLIPILGKDLYARLQEVKKSFSE